jgi:hypothetical protein
VTQGALIASLSSCGWGLIRIGSALAEGREPTDNLQEIVSRLQALVTRGNGDDSNNGVSTQRDMESDDESNRAPAPPGGDSA